MKVYRRGSERDHGRTTVLRDGGIPRHVRDRYSNDHCIRFCKTNQTIEPLGGRYTVTADLTPEDLANVCQVVSDAIDKDPEFLERMRAALGPVAGHLYHLTCIAHGYQVADSEEASHE